jgi:hypothetical protein
MTDNTAGQAKNLVDDTARKAAELVDDTTKKAAELADQARHAVDDTVAAATEAIRKLDLETTAETAITSVRVLAAETADNVTAVYKRNPLLVIALGFVAAATIALLAKRR